MARIKFNTKLSFSESKLIRKINDFAAAKLNALILPKRAAIRKYIRELIREAIKNTPESESMEDNGALAAQFGFELGKGREYIEAVAERVADSAFISVPKARRVGKQVACTIEIGIVLSSYADVLGLDEAEYDSENAQGETHPVTWLQWLLLSGDSIINPNYGLLFRKGNVRVGKSRSGNAIMLPLSDKLKNPFIIFPSFYTGLEGDNWLTRAFTRDSSFIDSFLLYLRTQVLR